MRPYSFLGAVLAAATLSAQSPLSLPFNSNNGLSASAAVFFDLTVVSPTGVTITGLDVNTSSTVGTNGTVELWTTPTTYVGSQQTAAAWTLQGAGGAVSAGTDVPTPVCLGSVFLAPGTYGVYIRHVGLAIRYTNSAAPVLASTAELQFVGGQSATANTAFGSSPINNRIFNGNIHYNIGNVAGPICATKETYGAGCYLQGDSWYELFADLTNFDLAGGVGTETVLVATPIGAAGYSVAAGASAWFTPTSAKLLNNATTPGLIGDDNMSDTITLPFSFTYPGGSVTVIHAAANGFIHLGPTTLTSSDFSPTVAELHNLQPRLFPAWADWDANINSTVNPATGLYFDVDPSGQTVYVTWLDVADRRGQTPVAGTTSINFQVALHSSGVIEYRYRTFLAAPTGAGPVIVGYSKGNNLVSGGPTSVDTGPRDLSAGPFSTNGPDSLPLALNSNLPKLGTNWDLVTTNIDPISPFSVTFFGSTRQVPPLDLGFIGAPGCFSHIDPIIVGLEAAATAGTSTLTIAIPNNPALAGQSLTAQSVCLTMKNAIGLLTSNGLEATLGQ